MLGESNQKRNINGCKFGDLELSFQSKIEDYQISTYIIKPPTPEYVKYDIFDRVNRGGTKLNAQEMRHALYHGPVTELLKELADLQSFKDATANTLKSTRMKDRYVILRFMAFYMLQKKLIETEYKSEINDFLANVMVELNKKSNLLNEFRDVFKTSMSNCFEIFGEDGFRFNPKAKQDKEGIKRPINMGNFEMISYTLATKLSLDERTKQKIKEMIDELKNQIDEKNSLP